MVSAFVIGQSEWIDKCELRNRTTYVFSGPTGHSRASAWRAAKLLAGGEVEPIDEGYRATPSGSRFGSREVYSVRRSLEEAVSDWLDCRSGWEYFHIFDLVEVV